MAGDRVRLVVKEREDCGSRASRRLRREGLIPGVLYGSGKPRSFSVDERELRRAFRGGHGMHAILDVVLDGQEKAHHAILKDYQLDPRRSTVIHVDLHEVRLDRPIQTQVIVDLVGVPEGVSRGGLMQQILREVNVEALPTAVPDRLELDVTALDIGDSVRVSEIIVPEGATILDDPDTVAAMVVAPRRVDLPEEGEEAAEGEEAPAEEGAEEATAEGGAETES